MSKNKKAKGKKVSDPHYASAYTDPKIKNSSHRLPQKNNIRDKKERDSTQRFTKSTQNQSYTKKQFLRDKDDEDSSSDYEDNPKVFTKKKSERRDVKKTQIKYSYHENRQSSRRLQYQDDDESSDEEIIEIENSAYKPRSYY
jgi:hypothetical protein